MYGQSDCRHLLKPVVNSLSVFIPSGAIRSLTSERQHSNFTQKARIRRVALQVIFRVRPAFAARPQRIKSDN
jgi:hypothetical protein